MKTIRNAAVTITTDMKYAMDLIDALMEIFIITKPEHADAGYRYLRRVWKHLNKNRRQLLARI